MVNRKNKNTFVKKSKKSNLKIETEDNCVVLGKQKNTSVKIDLNYTSLKKKRIIILNGKDFKFIIDLITFKIILFKNKRKKIKQFKKKQIEESYFLSLKTFV